MDIFFEKRCWAEVDLTQIQKNFACIQKNTSPPTEIIAVVKANAYGHGDIAVVRALEKAGAARFAVAGFGEAVRLRKAGLKKPLLILGYTSPENAAALSALQVEQCVPNIEYARMLSAEATKSGVTIPVHIKADTGMGRLGFTALADLQEAADTVAEACRLPGLVPAGLFTHFSAADSLSPGDTAYTKKQGETLLALRDALLQRGVSFPLVHACNSGGIATQPPLHLNAIRPGIMLYGYAPGPNVALPCVAPALKLKAVVSMVKTIHKGQQVSYGRTFTAPQDIQVATIAAGYADGYPRLLSGRGVVGFKGQGAPVIGRVCMDQIVIDASGIPGIKTGDTVTLLGGDGADSIDCAAEKTRTISYDIVCGIGQRVPRLYLENGKITSLVNYLEGSL